MIVFGRPKSKQTPPLNFFTPQKSYPPVSSQVLVEDGSVVWNLLQKKPERTIPLLYYSLSYPTLVTVFGLEEPLVI